MELRQLKYFVAVAEERNFTRAAARLHITQPPLSVQIRHLEEEVGTPLLVREGRGVALTEAGRVFLEQARQSIAYANRAVMLAKKAANGEIGHLSIGHNGPAELLVLPFIVPAFTERWPNVQLDFQIPGTPKIVERVRQSELDLGFVWQPVPTDEFEVQNLLDIPFVAVLPSSHRLAAAQRISVKDLSEEPLLLYSRAQDIEFFHQVEQLFLNAGAVMNVVYEFETLLSIINFVAMGRGCSLLPDYTLLNRMDGIVHKPMKPPNIVKTMAIIKKKERGGLAENFYQMTVAKFANGTARVLRSDRRRRSPVISR
jgi:DNA-binding transcriptional LysR family regulator